MNKITTEYSAYKKTPSKIIIGFKNMLDETAIFGLLCVAFFVVGFFLPAAINFENTFGFTIGASITCGLAFLIVFLMVFNLLERLRWLKPYGLSRKTPIFIIDFHEEQVKQLELVRAYRLEKSFDGTVFECHYCGDAEYLVNGEDIFFSSKDANAVLDLVQKENDEAIKKYYPEWKKDKNFTDFYSSRTKSGVRRFGFGRYTSSTDVVLVPIEIDGIKYFPSTSAKDFVKSFVDEMEKIKNKKQAETQEERSIIRKLNLYKSESGHMEG